MTEDNNPPGYSRRTVVKIIGTSLVAISAAILNLFGAPANARYGFQGSGSTSSSATPNLNAMNDSDSDDEGTQTSGGPPLTSGSTSDCDAPGVQ